MPKDNEKRVAAIKALLKSYPDFPKKGILFWDIFPIMRNPTAHEDMCNIMFEYINESVGKVDSVGALESRGFLMAPILALKLNVPFFPIRKPGKLPGKVSSRSYKLEYGVDKMEVQTEAVKTGDRILIVDDLLATGGTMSAAVKLVTGLGGQVIHCMVVIELVELRGAEGLGVPHYSMMKL